MPFDSIVVNFNIFKQYSIVLFSGNKQPTVNHVICECVKEAFVYSIIPTVSPAWHALNNVIRQ